MLFTINFYVTFPMMMIGIFLNPCSGISVLVTSCFSFSLISDPNHGAGVRVPCFFPQRAAAFTNFSTAMYRYTTYCRGYVQICHECWRVLHNSLLLIVTPTHLAFTETIWMPVRDILSDRKRWIHVDLLLSVSNKFLFTHNWLKHIHVLITDEIPPHTRLPLGTDQ